MGEVPRRPYIHIPSHCASIVATSTLTLTLPGPSTGVSGSLDNYCSIKPLCSGTREVVPARTSQTLLPHPLALCCHYPVSKYCSASIAVTSTVRVKSLFMCQIIRHNYDINCITRTVCRVFSVVTPRVTHSYIRTLFICTE